MPLEVVYDPLLRKTRTQDEIRISLKAQYPDGTTFTPEGPFSAVRQQSSST